MSKTLHQISLPSHTEPVVSLDAAESKEFGRILTLVNKVEDYTCLVIQDSVINQPLTDFGIFIEADLSKLIGKDVSMNFLLKNEDLKRIRPVMDSGPTSICYDSENNSYWIISNHQIESMPAVDIDHTSITPAPVIDSSKYVGKAVEIEDTTLIKKYIPKSDPVILMLYEDQLEQVMTFHQNAPFTFKASGYGSLFGRSPNREFICHSFLALAQKSVNLRLAQHEDTMFLITETMLNLIVGSIKIYQPVYS